MIKKHTIHKQETAGARVATDAGKQGCTVMSRTKGKRMIAQPGIISRPTNGDPDWVTLWGEDQ